MATSEVRFVSGKIFGNQKLVEVVLALAAESGVATAKSIATRTGVDHSLVRDVLLKLVDAGLITPMPRAHARAPQYYDLRQSDPIWLALLTLAEHVARQHGRIVQPGRERSLGGPSTSQ